MLRERGYDERTLRKLAHENRQAASRLVSFSLSPERCLAEFLVKRRFVAGSESPQKWPEEIRSRA